MYKKLYALSLSSLFFSASYNILLPELPKYLINIGGKEYLGFIILLFTIAALVSRPFSGFLSDQKGGKFVIAVGVLVSLGINLLYPIFPNVFGFLLLRFVHGFSTGFAPTGYTYFAKNNFSDKGKAISIQTAFYTSGMAIGPLFSSYITENFGIEYLFYAGSALALLSMLLVLPLKEIRNREKQPISTHEKSKSLIDFKIWKPAVCMFWVYLSFGILLIASPLIVEKIGFENKGAFFFFFTISTIVSRLILSNQFHQSKLPKLLQIASFLLILSSLFFGIWQEKIGFISASLLYGFAMGIFVPALNLWTINSNSGEDGKAISTLYIFMELGIGIGAFLIGALIVKYESAFKIVNISYLILSIFILYFLLKTPKQNSNKV